MVEPVRHRRTKGAATDMFEPKATASHLDSTRLRRTGGFLGMSANSGMPEVVGRRPKRRDWASSPMSPADFCVGPAQPDRENPAEREEQVARERRTAL